MCPDIVYSKLRDIKHFVGNKQQQQQEKKSHLNENSLTCTHSVTLAETYTEQYNAVSTHTNTNILINTWCSIVSDLQNVVISPQSWS